MYSEGEGEAAVRLARWSIESQLQGEKTDRPQAPPSFAEKGGAFVTLETYPELQLRGCIGYPEPTLPVGQAILKAAIASCRDPRFPPLSGEELEKVVVEVSLLTPPELIQVRRPLDYTKEILVGRDGIVVERGPYSGLLLPQVPVEWSWDVEEFLSQGCMKAGLMPDAWFDSDVKVYTFQAEIFKEEEPRGKVTRRGLQAVHDGHRR